MNILLVDLGTPREEISEPFGIEVLASYVENCFSDEISLTLKSLELDNLPDVGKYLQERFYSVIGISTKIRAFDKFKNCVDKIHSESPRSLIVVGDILGTYAFEEVLLIYKGVICVRGEGEVAFLEIIKEALRANGKPLFLSHIPNLAYITNNDIKLTKRKAMNLSESKHPKRFLAQEVLKQNGIARVEASRGCAYSLCDFCGTVEKYNGPGWRPFDLDFVIDELITLSQIGFKSPYFTDEDFFGNDIPRAYDLAKKIIEAKKSGAINPDLDFYINLRVNSVYGVGFGGEKEARNLLIKLKEAGLREIFIGLESGCKNQLKRYKKGTTKRRNIEAVKTLKNLGLEVDLGFIFFDPESTLEDLRENLNFIYEAGINYHDSSLIKRLRIEPRTPMGFEYLRRNPNAKVNLDLVEYPYSFRNLEVQAIFETFRTWQKEDLDVIYNIQSFCRGEIPAGYTRFQIKEILSKYRDLDIHYLDQLIRVFEQEESDKDTKIRNITQEFSRRREQLDNTQIDRIKWLDSNYRRRIS